MSPEAGSARGWHLGLVGWPLEHSLSPPLHKAALRSLGLEGKYDLLPVPPLPEGQVGVEDIMGRLRNGGLHGLNVTIPHKQTVVPLVDECTPVAEAVGAVNTIIPRNGKLVGDNTDSPAFYTDLRKQAWQQEKPEGGRALVLGAGGAARAVTFALIRQGWGVILYSRTFQKAADIASSFALFPGMARAMPSLTEESDIQVDLVVNATPVGMWPNSDACVWPQGLPLPAGAAVYDLVYNPPVTSLVRLARQAGHPAVSGLGMLVEQAALAFTAWTGLVPDRADMTAAANRHLGEGWPRS